MCFPEIRTKQVNNEDKRFSYKVWEEFPVSFLPGFKKNHLISLALITHVPFIFSIKFIASLIFISSLCVLGTSHASVLLSQYAIETPYVVTNDRTAGQNTFSPLGVIIEGNPPTNDLLVLNSPFDRVQFVFDPATDCNELTLITVAEYSLSETLNKPRGITKGNGVCEFVYGETHSGSSIHGWILETTTNDVTVYGSPNNTGSLYTRLNTNFKSEGWAYAVCHGECGDILQSYELTIDNIPNTGVNTSVPIQIEAVNAAGNRATSIYGTVAMSTSPDVQISPTELDMSAGLATGTVTFSAGSNPMILSARIDGLSADSNTFTVTNPTATPSSITFRVLWGGQPLGDGRTATVHLTDNNGVEVAAIADGSVDSNARFTGLTSGIYRVWAELDQNAAIHSPRNLIRRFIPDSKDRNSFIDMVDTRKDPVLIVPGMMGSTTGGAKEFFPMLPTTFAEASDLKILQGPTDYVELETLTEALQTNFAVYPMPWDWRMTMDETSGVQTAFEKYLMEKINEARDPNQDGYPDFDKVHIVAHSMGGLLTRAYIQSTKYRNDIDKFVMLGTPNEGSTIAYYIVHGGDSIKAGEIYKQATRYLMEQSGEKFADYYTHCESGIGGASCVTHNDQNTEGIRDYYIRNIPTGKQLLPTYPFLNKRAEGGPIALTVDKNDLLNRLNNDQQGVAKMINGRNTSTPVDKIKTVIFVSNSENTDNLLQVDAPSASSATYPEGAPNAAATTVAGDETVTEDSAAAKNDSNACTNSSNGSIPLSCWTDVLVCANGAHAKMFGNFAEQVRTYLSGLGYACP